MRALAGIACVAFALSCGTAQPPSAAEARARQLLAACADDAALRAFAEAAYAPSYVAERGLEGLLEADQRACRQSGGLRLTGEAVRTADTFFAFAEGQRAGNFRIAVTTDREGRIVRRSIAPSLPPAAETLVSGTAVDRAALDRYLDQLAARDLFSGVVLVAHGDRVLYEGARGLADLAASRAATTGTRFGLASTGKMFTATAILQLAEKGSLKLSDRVSDLLPEFPNRALGERITVEELLTHTSGLPMFFDRLDVLEMYVDGAPIERFLPLIAQLEDGPAPRAMYSNAGYLLLGAIVEKRSGLPFEEYLRRNVFAPARMDSTVLSPGAESVGAAVTYSFLGGDGRSRQSGCGDRCGREAGSSAGGGYTTARDLFRFLRALTGGRLVKAASLERMATARVLSPWGSDYGYGLAIERVGTRTFIGHAGDYVGTNAEAVTDGDWTIVVLSNYERPAATGVADVLKAAIARAR